MSTAEERSAQGTIATSSERAVMESLNMRINPEERVYVPVLKAFPYMRSSFTTADCMILVLISLLPCVGFALYHNGARCGAIIGISIVTAFLAELLCDLIMRKEATILDYSALVTGLIGALILPPNIPLYYPVISAAAAILIGKMIFGGIGKNFVNPAAFGKAVLVILMNTVLPALPDNGFSQVPPLVQFAEGNTVSLRGMLLGGAGGFIGTASAVPVIVGAVFLFATGVTDIVIPLAYLISYSIFFSLFGGFGLDSGYLAVQLMGGGLLFTAFFMANDYTTSPMSGSGRILYGILLGILTGIFRLLGLAEDACVFALLIGNVFVRLIDRAMIPRAFGTAYESRRILHLGRNRKKAAEDDFAEGAETEDGIRTNESIDREFNEFFASVMPKEAAEASETAGTIDQDAFDAHYYERRSIRKRR